ncbi:SusC/RagA family TonB-linked outer membrane protein [Desertivirga brevis]|uniref:SusC/RagA family TonB-linked outer membrane protein n=1 Tax=Desertivirga brevis TaxID=2810310 RepID=UPI001A9776AF|nr:SusC/RagA family TonB-linked outer membrane protein [Pedobacter sp. SYSU D00873]
MHKRYLITVLLCLLALGNCLFAQSKFITGIVRDADNQPLPGANVQVLNTTIGTSTDAEGRFRLALPGNGQLVISFTGFKTQTRAIQSIGETLELKLEDDIAKLDEVVVTGLATNVQRRNLANTVVSISSKELSGVAPAQTFDAALNGKVPGAYINANSGAPGGGLSIRLRGLTSIYGNSQPLFVLDGVIVDNSSVSSGLTAVTKAVRDGSVVSNQDNPSSRIADIRPEDVENIEILKGASAAAIYGSRAAAGVILITTKKGRAGKTQVSFSQDYGNVKVRKLLGVRNFTAETAASLSNDPVKSAELRQQFLDAQAKGRIYDYEKEIYGNTGVTRNSVLSISGGNERTGLYFSAGTKDEDGIIKNTGYRNNSLRLNVNHKVNENIKVSINTNYINSSADRGITNNDNSGNSLGWALAQTPGFVELHANQYGVYPANTVGGSNFLQTIAQVRNNEGVNRFITGLNIEAGLLRTNKSNTKLVTRGGIDFYNLSTDVLFPATLQTQDVAKGSSVQGFTRNLNTNYIISLVNTYAPGSAFTLTSSAGITQERGEFNNAINVATQLTTGQSNINQAGALSAYQDRRKFQNDGVFVQEEALIANALSLTAGIRFDRSTNNGDPGKFYIYPKGGASFNFTQSGLIRQGFVEDLKVRAAYGQATNTPAYGSKFTSLGISNIIGFLGSLVNTQQGQAKIKPERQTEFETGLDFSVLKGRVGLQATYYKKTIEDFLLLSNPPASSGFATSWVNAGDLKNHGLELGLTARPVDAKLIKWNTSFNYWLNRAKVTRLTTPPVPQGVFGYLAGSFKLEEGRSPTQIVGVDATSPTGLGYFGDIEPRFQLSSNNEVQIGKNLSFLVLLHWKNGGQNINLTNISFDRFGTSADYDVIEEGHTLPNGPTRGSKIGSTSAAFVENSSYFRVRELGVYYSFNKLPRSIARNVKFGISLNNYFTKTNYRSYDPEVSNFGNGFSSNADMVPYPASKRAQAHLSVNF